MSKTILITGGTGLIGTALTEILLKNDYQVSYLGRGRISKKSVKSYIWNINDGFIEDGAVESANIVIHLAGAGVADKRWTNSRKKEILQSRVQSTRLLFSKLASTNNPCETVISSSAIGIYGIDTGSTWVSEESPAGEGFLAEVTKQWEEQIARFDELKLRVVTLRTGLVLSKKGGALPKIASTVKWYAGAVIGSGRQYMSWIHIEDLCRIMLAAIENGSIGGVYNAVAPTPVTNREFTKTLAQVLNKPILMPAVPGFALKIALGEMAGVVLGGNRVSAEKVLSAGYKFKYPELPSALEEIYR